VSSSLGEAAETASSRGVAGIRESKQERKLTESKKTVSSSEKEKLKDQKAAYEKDLKNLSKRLDELAKEEQSLLQKTGSSARDISDIKILTGSQIKRFIPDNMALIEYYVGEQSVIAAVISNKSMLVIELNLKPDKLKQQIMAFRYDVENESYDYKANGILLYDELVRPLEKHLTGIDEVGIIPHGVLHYLPFQALIVGDESERGVDPQLVEKEKILVAMRGCVTDRPNRGVAGVRQSKPAAGAAQDCETLMATRGVKGTREIKGTGQKATFDVQATMTELESVRSAMAAARTEKGVRDGRPIFLIDKFKVFYAPSSSILSFVHSQNADRKERLFAIGSPPPIDVKDLKEAGLVGIDVLPKLPATKTEVQSVSSLFSAKTSFTDEAATETAAKNNVSQHDMLLFSTHGLLNRKEPLKSAVFLNKDSSNDGRLTVSEIEGLRLNANLVVLSACQTGLMSGYEGVGDDITDAKFPHGDDLVGLQRAFMKAGSASVMSTLWEVQDDSTSALVVDFFKRFSSGKDRAAALQEAELELMRTKKDWEHPYYWAPFVLSGDWR
jgi:CHAT domain-containing protein